jgi:hypothetical protein
MMYLPSSLDFILLLFIHEGGSSSVVVVVSLQLLCTPAIPSFLLQGLLRSARRSNRFAF